MAVASVKTLRVTPTRTASDHVPAPLSRSKSVRFISLALIALATPYLNSVIHGLAGFALIMVLALIFVMAEGKLSRIMANIHKGLTDNKLSLFLSVWYMLGVVGNIYIRGAGAGWRPMMGPIFLVFGLILTLAIYHDDGCAKWFRFMLLVATGIQSVYSFFGIISDLSIAREMYITPEGNWLYGEQASFALYAIVIPLFFQHAFQEKRKWKYFLLVASTMALLSLSVSTLATPILLCIIHLVVIFILSFLLTKSRKVAIRNIAWGCGAVLVILAGYLSTRDLPAFSPVYYRIINLLEDPLSGGYSGNDIGSSRLGLADISIASFKESPLFGMGGGDTKMNDQVGGHSSLLDTLGAYGLLGGGGALCALIGTLLVKAFLRVVRERDWEAVVSFSTVVSLAIAGIVNPNWEGIQPVYVLLLARPLVNNSANLK